MSSTPYDDVFRTLLTDCTELMIPVVNEMFEYDTQIALENRELTPDTLTVSFPDSAIISLRHTLHTPDKMNINILTPGGNVSYNIPVLKVRQYSASELFEKHLFFLIPFHIFVYEKTLMKLNKMMKS